MEKTLNWLRTQPVAHRGLHDSVIPENSLASFEEAISKGYAIELDVQVIADQSVIVFHDYDTERMCGGDKMSVHSLIESDLGTLMLNGSQQTIPLLREVLKLVNGRVPLLIEIKREPGRKLNNMPILNVLLPYRGEIAIQSFDPRDLVWLKKNAPHIVRGQLASDFKEIKMHWLLKYLLSEGKFNFMGQPDFLAYDINALPKKWVARQRSKKKPVLGWTVTGEEALASVKKHCDNIIFEGFHPVRS